MADMRMLDDFLLDTEIAILRITAQTATADSFGRYEQ
jgi:hypothetical protein